MVPVPFPGDPGSPPTLKYGTLGAVSAELRGGREAEPVELAFRSRRFHICWVSLESVRSFRRFGCITCIKRGPGDTRGAIQHLAISACMGVALRPPFSWSGLSAPVCPFDRVQHFLLPHPLFPLYFTFT